MCAWKTAVTPVRVGSPPTHRPNYASSPTPTRNAWPWTRPLTLAYLCTSPYDVRLAQERFPKIHFHPLREHAGLALRLGLAKPVIARNAVTKQSLLIGAYALVRLLRCARNDDEAR
jgi:hypothetical protein